MDDPHCGNQKSDFMVKMPAVVAEKGASSWRWHWMIRIFGFAGFPQEWHPGRVFWKSVFFR